MKLRPSEFDVSRFADIAFESAGRGKRWRISVQPCGSRKSCLPRIQGMHSPSAMSPTRTPRLRLQRRRATNQSGLRHNMIVTLARLGEAELEARNLAAAPPPSRKRRPSRRPFLGTLHSVERFPPWRRLLPRWDGYGPPRGRPTLLRGTANLLTFGRNCGDRVFTLTTFGRKRRPLSSRSRSRSKAPNPRLPPSGDWIRVQSPNTYSVFPIVTATYCFPSTE